MRILLAIPTAKYVECDTFKSIYDLNVPQDVQLDLKFFYGYRIDQIRNLICDHAIKGRYNYVFFVDSDIGLPANALVKLLECDASVACGLYRVRDMNNLLYEVYDKDLQRITQLPEQDVFPIGGCGFGCTLVHHTVINEVGYPQFEYHIGQTADTITLSEDNDFCRKACKLGHKIVCDQTIRCDHYGSINFSLPH